jgi:hypothetical protein
LLLLYIIRAAHMKASAHHKKKHKNAVKKK